MGKATYTLKWNKDELTSLKRKTFLGMKALAYKIEAQAKHGAPVDTGALVNSIRTTDDNQSNVLILAGGSISGKKILYAKRREYENRKNPQTKYYMRNAFKWGEENYQKYFKEITK